MKGKSKKIGTFAAIIFAALLASNAYANDLRIENGSVFSVNTLQNTATVQFDLSWKNSWKDMVNFDAVWIFAKYSTDGGTTWKHLTLDSSGIDPYGFDTGVGTDIELNVPDDRKGLFVQRSYSGTGEVDTDEIQIVWDYGFDGLSDEELENISLKVFGVEVVYIPEGAFFAGDNKTSIASFVQGNAAVETDPWYVEDERGISVENIANNGFYYQSAGNPGEAVSGAEFIIPASFSKGYQAFYVMKYEVSEGQWVSFFNTLSPAQKTNLDLSGAAGKNTDAVLNRNTFSWDGTNPATTLRPDRACGFLSWSDLCAYADWAGLRPMTELEFEKISRGTDITAVSGELPWGNTTLIPAVGLDGDEDGTETASNVLANCVYGDQTFTGGDGGKGPLRVGVFATSTSTKQNSGAGYFGVMEMSGNLWERCVTVGNPSGRAYRSTNGDGALSSGGYATNDDWPGYDPANGVVGADGSGFRGGSWQETTLNFMAVSNRSKAALSDPGRGVDYGGRCVRTAP